MPDHSCQVLVVGAGPGGYVAAIRAGQLGLDTIIVEAVAHGGTCLNVGCIPSKALIHAADEFDKAKHFSNGSSIGVSVATPAIDLTKTMQWKDGIVKRLTGGVGVLLKKNKVHAINGWARFLDGKTVVVETPEGEKTIVAENVIIATGSRSVELPFMPFGGDVISSTEALSLTSVPKTLAVVGGGYIGLEMGIAFAKLGAKVSVIEAQDRILPLYDPELTKPVAKRMAALGIDVHLNAKAKGASSGNIEVETSDSSVRTIPAEKILVTVGRAPLTDGWGLDQLSLDMADQCVAINDRCETSMRGVYAIGDVTGEPMLAHRAMAQGEMVAELIAGQTRQWDKRVIPAICFTDPEIVSAGMLPDEATAAGEDILTQGFPFAANGRAMTMEAEDGFVRIVARKSDHLVLGIQAVGGGVAELAASFGLAIEMGARLEDIAGTIHAHPTQGEAFQEAALRTLGHALHI